MRHILYIVILLTSQLTHAYEEHFSVKKSGQGQAVILIPGLSSSGDTWDSTLATFSDYETHVLTLAGFAGQPTTVIDNYIPTMRDEVINYLEENKLVRPIIVGHSLGGFIALEIAIKEPDLLSRIVIVDSLPFLPAMQNPHATAENMIPIALNMRTQMQNQTDEQYKATAPMFMSTMTNDETKLETIIQWGLASDRKVSGQAMYELFTRDLRDELEVIKVPTLVLGAWVAFKNYGATRESSLAGYTEQYAKLDSVEIKMTDTGKHFIMWDDAEFFDTEVSAFLSK